MLLSVVLFVNVMLLSVVLFVNVMLLSVVLFVNVMLLSVVLFVNVMLLSVVLFVNVMLLSVVLFVNVMLPIALSLNPVTNCHCVFSTLSSSPRHPPLTVPSTAVVALPPLIVTAISEPPVFGR